MKLFNAVIMWLLQTPLHGLVSGSFMLLTVTGRKSGKQFTFPVEYTEHDGLLLVFSRTERTWWRNLRGGAPVTVRLRGQERSGTATALPDDVGAFEEAIRVYLGKHPGRAKMFDVQRDANGDLDPASITQSAQNKVTIHIQLN